MNLSRGNKLFRSKGESNIFPQEHLDEIIFIDRPFLLLSWARMFRCTVPAKRMIRERRVCVLPEGNSLEAYFEFLVNTALHLTDVFCGNFIRLICQTNSGHHCCYFIETRNSSRGSDAIENVAISKLENSPGIAQPLLFPGGSVKGLSVHGPPDERGRQPELPSISLSLSL